MRAWLGMIGAVLDGCASGPVDPVGAWGGDHISVTVGASESTIEFDCAHGRIDGPFVVDADGRFDLAGVFVREGGPARIDDTESSVGARYFGAIDGRRMTLAIDAPEIGAPLGPYPLEKDRAPMLVKCL